MFFFSFSAQRGPRRAETARPGLPRAHRPHPGRNLGLGRQSAARARSRLGLDLAQRISSVRLDPTAERPFRAVKTTAAAGALENPSAFAPALSLSSSPHSLFSLQRSAAATESERRRASGPLRCRRPPRRRACSPTGEHAAVERPWPRRFLGRARRARAPGSASSPAPAKKAGSAFLLLPRRWRFIRRTLALPLLSPFFL